MKSFFDEFKKFALRGNAIDLAVGVVIGAAFNAITNSLVTNIITPPLSLLTRGINFADLAIAIPNTDAYIQYGLFIQAIITFVITAFALFLLVKVINKVTAKARKDAEEGKGEPVAKSAELQVLEEIRDSLKKTDA
ncbi:MAG TPA: large conductance mechanosensitive channel protein MscL [Candidatus Paceibacterota bacterium]|nr:large conductance mechanosensitive channel protein MscL [Candidatus Paceibacterota bacterium]